MDLLGDPPLPAVRGSGEMGGLAVGKVKAKSARGSGEDRLRTESMAASCHGD